MNGWINTAGDGENMGALGAYVNQLSEQTTEIELERRIRNTKIELVVLETALEVKKDATRHFWKRNFILEFQAYLKPQGIVATDSEIRAAMAAIREEVKA